MKAITSPMGRRPMAGSAAKMDMALEYRCMAGAYIRDARAALELRQQDLAELIGFGATALSNIERGRTALAADRWDQVADALEIERETFTKVMLRYSNPWAYRTLFGRNDKALAEELNMIPERYFNPAPKRAKAPLKDRHASKASSNLRDRTP